MSTTSFTYFSHFPPELQLEVWRQVVGPPQIHILRPAPADVFHWVQDFACPIYQAIYAGTNKPVEGDPSKRDSPLFACKAANDALKDKLMKVDLSIFGPGRQVGSYTPSQSRDRLYIDHIIGPLRNAVDSFLRAAVFTNLFKYYVENPERLEENLLMIIHSVTLVMAVRHFAITPFLSVLL
ncbi:hypothetical protein NUW58_g5263 [Xylaria curta]|uniref:Uncharacterized protein n=1 Tax=Xylaria curta TaxID=42375 RepID=A0ACC1P2J9_9PEZI|nr:hypothetical protein NUW58_g5263 [Xylaria curta]